MKRIFDLKASDQTVKGLHIDQIKNWLNGVNNIESMKYYYYPPDSKFPAESLYLKDQPLAKALSFLEVHFTETLDEFVEVQRKMFRSGRQEIILRAITPKQEIVKIGVLEVSKPIS